MENLQLQASLISNLRDLYKNSLMTDFAIKIEGKKMKAHKTILCARNRAFFEIISTHPGVNKIKVRDLQAEAFETFLHFLYTGDLDKDNVNEHLLRVAQKFSAFDLKQICEDHLVEQMEKSDAMKTLIFALEMDSKVLVDKACSLIVQNYDELKYLDEFKNLTFNEKASAAIFDAFGGSGEDQVEAIAEDSDRVSDAANEALDDDADDKEEKAFSDKVPGRLKRASTDEKEESAVGYDATVSRIVNECHDSEQKTKPPGRPHPVEDPDYVPSPGSVLRSAVTPSHTFDPVTRQKHRSRLCTWCKRWGHLRIDCNYLHSIFIPCRLYYCKEAHLHWMKVCPRYPNAPNQPRRRHHLDFLTPPRFNPNSPGNYFCQDPSKAQQRENLYRRPAPVERGQVDRRPEGPRRGNAVRGDQHRGRPSR